MISGSLRSAPRGWILARVRELDLRIRNEVYSSFVRTGDAPSAAETAVALGLAEGEVADAYRRLHEAHALVLQPGTTQVRMLNPFSAVETPHRVEAAGRSWFANCAWDALGIPAALHADGLVRSACPDCGERSSWRCATARSRAAPTCSSTSSSPRGVVGRHRLHLRNDGLPPVGGAPGALAGRERLASRARAWARRRSTSLRADGGGRGWSRTGGRARLRSRRRSSTSSA